jgi:hypothetical protein
MSPVSRQWLAIVRDVVSAAAEGLSIQEFDRRSVLQPLDVEASHFDRVRVLEKLIEDQVVAVEDRCLALGRIDRAGWLLDGMKAGNSMIWEVAQLVDAQERVIRKFDLERLAEVGAIGEQFIVSELKRLIPPGNYPRIRHISLEDDSAGYDVLTPSVTHSDQVQLLEVKTSVRPGNYFTCFVSRNEFRVGCNNSNWSLVCVRLIDTEPTLLGHVSINAIRNDFPVDQGPSIRWESSQVQIPMDVLRPGLP